MINTVNVGASTALPGLGGIEEIRLLLVKISRERVLELTFRANFPEPAADLAEGAVWFLDEVEAWIKENGNAVAEVFKHDDLNKEL
jgi:prophage regulatory protein